MKPKNNLKIGKIGEDEAELYLKKKGYLIIERNFRKQYGDIDIVALKEKTLVFVEVKTRTGTSFGSPEDSITSYKLRNLVKSAQFYKLYHPRLPDSLRIDLIAVNLSASFHPSIKHYENISMF
ncbi:YraN family protein [Patescibacteria group bacterium]|nr:YraN family protein [Patescibacteria group bacterium]MCL5797736.1 YraN family protein [Patescibacteria group bacterium]